MHDRIDSFYLFLSVFLGKISSFRFVKLNSPGGTASLGGTASYSPRPNCLINLAACRGVPSEFLFITAEIFRPRRRGVRNISLDGRRMVACVKVSFD